MRKKLLLIALSFFAQYGFSQNYLGVHSSNYIGVMGLDVQPASFVDGRFVTDVNLFSGNVTAWTNIVKFDTRDMPGWWLKSFKKDTAWMSPDTTFNDRYLIDNYKLGSKKKLGAYSNMQVDILNFAFHVTPKIAIGLSTSI